MDQKPENQQNDMEEFSRKEKRALVVFCILFLIVIGIWGILQTLLPEETKQSVVNWVQSTRLKP